jgi:hypothetical protein
LGNPTKYTDPTGHRQSDGCEYGECSENWKPIFNRERQDWLFTLIFAGSGEAGAWTTEDWSYYLDHRGDLWSAPETWINSEGASGWQGFATHVERLASHYGPGDKEQFVRDFALVFAGISCETSWYQAALEARGGPLLPFLNEGNGNLGAPYHDSLAPNDNQSHHYAGLYFLSYFAEPEVAVAINVLRDPDNNGDIALGNRAASQAYYFRYYAADLAVVSNQIDALAVTGKQEFRK